MRCTAANPDGPSFVATGSRGRAFAAAPPKRGTHSSTLGAAEARSPQVDDHIGSRGQPDYALNVAGRSPAQRSNLPDAHVIVEQDTSSQMITRT